MNLSAAREMLSSRVTERRGAVHLSLERDEQVAHIRIDHPSARNALSVSMMVDLADVILRLKEWNGRLILLSSADPRAFCSGGDLSDVVRSIDSREAAAEMSSAMSIVLAALKDNPAISVAALDGPAIGGGAELATAVDFRVAGPEARFQFVQGKLGIAPGWGGSGRLVQIVGRSAALRLLISTRSIGPGEAILMGLADHRCDGSAVEGALAWLEDLFEMPKVSARAIKQQIVAAEPTAVLDADAAAFADVWGGAAHREALERLARHQR